MLRLLLLCSLFGLVACGRSSLVGLGDDPRNPSNPNDPNKPNQCTLVPDVRLTIGAEGGPTDILLVVDNSGDMDRFQDRLSNSVPALIDAIGGVADYRIGVVTTDVSGPRERVGFRRSNFKEQYPNTILSIDDADCRETNVRVGCPITRPITSLQPRDEQVTRLREAVRLGTCGDGANESGLVAIQLALNNTLRGLCGDSTFIRQDSRLVVIVLSNEDDVAPREPSVGDLLNSISSQHAIQRFRFAVLGGIVDGAPAACATGRTSCGGLCQMPPPPGSGQTCRSARDCADNEFCAQGRCESRDLQFFEFCEWCSYYRTADCCAALEANRYHGFAQEVVRRSAQFGDRISTRCEPVPGMRTTCIVESICQ